MSDRIRMGDRSVEITAVTEITDSFFTVESGWSFGIPAPMKDKISLGQFLLVETKNLSMVTGIMDYESGGWYFRKSDRDLEVEHEEFVARMKKDREEMLERNREDWQKRTEALPWWVRARIERFQKSPGFATDGWGYELIIAELAVMYFDSEGEDTDDIMAFAREHGTSGNQHDFAKALAREHREKRSVADTVSALSPITGDPDYSKGL